MNQSTVHIDLDTEQFEIFVSNSLGKVFG